MYVDYVGCKIVKVNISFKISAIMEFIDKLIFNSHPELKSDNIHIISWMKLAKYDLIMLSTMNPLL